MKISSACSGTFSGDFASTPRPRHHPVQLALRIIVDGRPALRHRPRNSRLRSHRRPGPAHARARATTTAKTVRCDRRGNGYRSRAPSTGPRVTRITGQPLRQMVRLLLGRVTPVVRQHFSEEEEIIAAGTTGGTPAAMGWSTGSGTGAVGAGRGVRRQHPSAAAAGPRTAVFSDGDGRRTTHPTLPCRKFRNRRPENSVHRSEPASSTGRRRGISRRFLLGTKSPSRFPRCVPTRQ